MILFHVNPSKPSIIEVDASIKRFPKPSSWNFGSIFFLVWKLDSRKCGEREGLLCTHNVGEGRSLIFTLVKGMFTIIKKGTNDWIE